MTVYCRRVGLKTAYLLFLPLLLLILASCTQTKHPRHELKLSSELGAAWVTD
jgi:hypothetical protein